jgi:diguanylate cyclase (GGDEF)-like protein
VVGFPVLGVLIAALEVRHRRSVRHLRELARTDELTGLPNRRAWNEQLPRELDRARRDSTPVSVAIVDLDHFKAFNDSHGHLAGDHLLQGLASGAGDRLRTTDVIARYGGEEFAVVLPGCGLDGAEEIIDRLREVVPGEHSYSAGIACWNGSETAGDLVARADRALYEAKRGGRARTITDPALHIGP